MKIINGIGIGAKRVRGKLQFLENGSVCVNKTNEFTSYDNEIERFTQVKKSVENQIKVMHKKALEEIGEDEAEIFEIHLMLLEDEDFNSAITAEISKGLCAENAIRLASAKYSDMLKDLNDEYLSERARDIKDIENQLLRAFEKNADYKNNDTSAHILVADDLSPSQTVMLDKSKILGFITFGGSLSSHTAILARAMGIPALVGTGKIDASHHGELALLDSIDGTVIISPTKEQLENFEKKEKKEKAISLERESKLKAIMNKPAVTKNGHRVLVYANVGSEMEVENARLNGAEGIGLFRSEIHYLSIDRLPNEEELFEAYKEAVLKMKGGRVIIRTLDIGADKQISYFNIRKEENPALGYRGVRICLDRVDVFKTQLRAILRASAYGKVAIMLPMIVSESEILRCKELLEECKNELFENNFAFDSKIELGIMIETPASAIMSRNLARHVKFFSVGTNDLTQYTLAVDRQNPKVADIAISNKEPVLRLIKYASDAIHENGGWIGICGEMGADLNLTQTFVDMKIDELSASVPNLLSIKEKVMECE